MRAFFFVSLLCLFCQQVYSSEFVGRLQCVSCHQTQTSLWSGSHHNLAMQDATSDTVLGNFANTRFTYFEITSEFSRRDGKYYVRTDGPDGSLVDYEIKYSFGIYPLQQYLVEFPNGKLQALPIAWDSRSKQAGGQRWFHLHPDEKVAHDDPLHWTGPAQNWNFMCAECHSSGLEKNYDTDSDSYQTTWSDIDVSCESCHGPGSQHIRWAQGENKDPKDNGLLVKLNERAQWSINPKTGLARRLSDPSPMLQVETCARCHSRRSVVDRDYKHGRDLIHTHRIETLQEDLYFPDGQIKDEVYVYGSFIQSKMYSKGVVCSDCHEPHSLELRVEGNDICLSCHLKSKFDTDAHHFHKSGTEGAQCVNCHMPSRTYMVVDDRRDHSFRIPRPDLSAQLGTPNACTSCHQDRDAAWAANVMEEQWQGNAAERPHFGTAIHAGQTGKLDAGNLLVALAQDSSQPSIARATAVSLLWDYLSPQSIEAIQKLTNHNDPLIRFNALSGLDRLEPSARIRIAFDHLDDPVLLVRIESARILTDVPDELLTATQKQKLQTVIDEYINSQLVNADTVQSHVNLGNLHSRTGDLKKAELEYKRGIEINPDYIPAYINLADLYRNQGRDDEGKSMLEGMIRKFPEIAVLRHAYGLILVRLKQTSQALEALGQAVDLEPDNTRFRYVYAIGLQSTGKMKDAIVELKKAHENYPADQDVLIALIEFHQQTGDIRGAKKYAELLAQRSPHDQNVKAFLRQLNYQGNSK